MVGYGVNRTGWRERLLESTRGRILQRLREREQTVNDLAAALGLTDNAVRMQLLSLERDGLVRQSGVQPGVRRPHAVYGLTNQTEHVFANAYGTLLDLVLAVVERRLSPREVRSAMRDVGRQVARLHAGRWHGRSQKVRMEAGLAVLQELGGMAVAEVREGRHWIRGHGCPLAAATARHPEACLIAESLLSEILGTRVRQRCCHNGAPSCLFQVH